MIAGRRAPVLPHTRERHNAAIGERVGLFPGRGTKSRGAQKADTGATRIAVTLLGKVGEWPAADRRGLHPASGDGPIAGRGTAGSGGPGPDLVLPRLGTLREPQSREY